MKSKYVLVILALVFGLSQASYAGGSNYNDGITNYSGESESPYNTGIRNYSGPDKYSGVDIAQGSAEATTEVAAEAVAAKAGAEVVTSHGAVKRAAKVVTLLIALGAAYKLKRQKTHSSSDTSAHDNVGRNSQAAAFYLGSPDSL